MSGKEYSARFRHTLHLHLKRKYFEQIKELEKEIEDQKELMKYTTGHHQEIHRSIGNAFEYTIALLQAGKP